MNAGLRVLALLLALALAGCAGVAIPSFDTTSSSGPGPAVVDGTLGAYLLNEGRRVTIERVIDGDTLAVTGDERVRLLSIDAPELRAHTNADDADPCAETSRDYLAGYLPVGTEVIVNGLKGEPELDRYGRTLANVYLPIASAPGMVVNVSLHMIEQGQAFLAEGYPTSDTGQAAELASRAADLGLGVWGVCP